MQSQDRMWPAISAKLTGNGSAQNFAHGLNGIPDAYMVILDDTSVPNYYTVGTITGTQIPVTVTNGAKYRVYAGFQAG